MYSSLVLPIVTILFSGFMFIVSLDYPFFSNNTLGGGAWPQMILGAMFVLGVILLFQELKAIKEKKAQMPEKKEEEKKEPEKKVYTHWIFFGVSFIFTLVVKYLGFSISMLFYVAACAYILGIKNKKTVALTAIISTLVVSIVFANLLKINLPEGTGIIKMINRAISMKLWF